MIMAWLDNELDAPIAKETWKNLLYMLSLLPVNDPEYGSLDLGVKLEEGFEAKEFALVVKQPPTTPRTP